MPSVMCDLTSCGSDFRAIIMLRGADTDGEICLTQLDEGKKCLLLAH